jgi:hypothetical protein
MSGSIRRGVHRTEAGFQIQHHQQPPEADELADHHAELENLFIREVTAHAIEEVVIHVVMIERHSICVLKRHSLRIAETVGRLIQLSNFLFG